jgi:multicomponent K+:H+ antiporter subunit G
MPFWAEVVVASLIGVGSFFMLVGSVALVKLPGTMRRLHGPTKATTLGIGALLLASMLYFALAHSSVTVHELLIAVFLLLTAPVSAHMIAKVWLLRESPFGQAAGGAKLADTGE